LHSSAGAGSNFIADFFIDLIYGITVNFASANKKR
jgi:hypothetical protein